MFHPLKNVCDAVFKRLHRKGVGTEAKVTRMLSEDEENILWEKGVISVVSPIRLLNAVFFIMAKTFA